MAAEPSTKARAWVLFDRIVADAAPDGAYSDPWALDGNGVLVYRPDYVTLTRLLGVPLHLKAATTTGVPALALDVWIAYELRRARLEPDAVWPRAKPPRILPAPIAALRRAVSAKERVALDRRLQARTPPTGVASSSASILGKNYLKQVDVVMSDWVTGPELLISTKRMDSSFGKNAANRVEESYGDAKNLRLRHPQAALGFVYGLRSTAFEEAELTARWIVDLLGKLGREEDAYHAVALIVIEYSADVAVEGTADAADGDEDPLVAAGVVQSPESAEDDVVETSRVEQVIDVEAALADLPGVVLRWDRVPQHLRPDRFLATMVTRVVDAAPVPLHDDARTLLDRARRSGVEGTC